MGGARRLTPFYGSCFRRSPGAARINAGLYLSGFRSVAFTEDSQNLVAEGQQSCRAHGVTAGSVGDALAALREFRLAGIINLNFKSARKHRMGPVLRYWSCRDGAVQEESEHRGTR